MPPEPTPPNWTVYRVPRSHYHCQLDTLDWSAIRPQGIRPAVEAFVRQVAEGGAPHMVLTGEPGSGKSHIGVGVYRAAAAAVGTELAMWLSVPAFCEEVKRSYADGGGDPWAEVTAARRLLVLDDLFGRELSAHEKDQIVTRLLDTAYTNGAGVLVTMNPGVDVLQQRLPPHEISRLLAAPAVIVPVVSKVDWRRQGTPRAEKPPTP